MKVLVDTSVWVDFFNEHPSREAATLTRLIEDEVELLTCGVVMAEFFQGIRNEATLTVLDRHFRSMRCLTPKEPDSYMAAAALFRDLRARGITIRSTIDCLIAILAEAHDVFLLAKDRDMALIIDSGLCDLHPVPDLGG